MPVLELPAMRHRSRALLCGVAALALVSLNGCQSYTPLTLPDRPHLAQSLSGLDLQGIDPAKPLDVKDVALLAANNSPDLSALRAQRGVSQANFQQSSLFANPAVSGAALPLYAGFGSTTAWNYGLTYDIRSLLTHNTRRREAINTFKALDATLLWGEWQTMAQARLLVVDIVKGDQILGTLRRAHDLFQGRAQNSRRALGRQDVTISTAAPDFAAVQGARDAVDRQEYLQLQRRHQLNALLGLAPDVMVPLSTNIDLPQLDPEAVLRDLPMMSERRPDLVALRFGYEAEDARLRTAILTQFPNVVFGVVASSDNANVRNIGPQVAFDLPIFDRNQGGIALERATREQLRREFIARSSAAEGQVKALLAEIDMLQAQLKQVRADLPDLSRIANLAQAAQAAGNIDERSALDLISARVTKEQDIVTLEQALFEQFVAIETLTGAGLPPLTANLADGT